MDNFVELLRAIRHLAGLAEYELDRHQLDLSDGRAMKHPQMRGHTTLDVSLVVRPRGGYERVRRFVVSLIFDDHLSQIEFVMTMKKCDASNILLQLKH